MHILDVFTIAHMSLPWYSIFSTPLSLYTAVYVLYFDLSSSSLIRFSAVINLLLNPSIELLIYVSYFLVLRLSFYSLLHTVSCPLSRFSIFYILDTLNIAVLKSVYVSII